MRSKDKYTYLNLFLHLYNADTTFSSKNHGDNINRFHVKVKGEKKLNFPEIGACQKL